MLICFIIAGWKRRGNNLIYVRNLGLTPHDIQDAHGRLIVLSGEHYKYLNPPAFILSIINAKVITSMEIFPQHEVVQYYHHLCRN